MPFARADLSLAGEGHTVTEARYARCCPGPLITFFQAPPELVDEEAGWRS